MQRGVRITLPLFTLTASPYLMDGWDEPGQPDTSYELRQHC